MTAHTLPIRAPQIDRWADVDALDDGAEDKAAEALARFQAKWPVERTRDMAAFARGDEAAGLRIAARALERIERENAADRAVRGLLTDAELLAHSKGQRNFAKLIDRARDRRVSR